MLAYLFWHWPKPTVAPHDYEAALRRFHSVLSTSDTTGFVRSFCFGIRGASWANDGSDAFEDWYLVESSAGLDPLNDAAISGRRQAAHDGAAAAAAGGTGGLYRLRRGFALPHAACGYWFSKPDGVSYVELYELLQPVLEEDEVALWGRQMTLGPALEFCLHAQQTLVLPPQLSAIEIRLRPVWPVDVAT